MKNIEPLTLSIADQRVLAVRNYISLLKQAGIGSKEAEFKAQLHCYDAWHLSQVYYANGIRPGQK